MKACPKLRKKLADRGLDAYIATKNVRYLSDTSACVAAIVSREAEPILICKRLEFERAKRESSIKEIYAYSPSKVPLRRSERVFFGEFWKVLIKHLRKLDAKVIGYDILDSKTIQKLQTEYHASYRELPDLILELRAIKDKEELARLRRAAQIAGIGMRLASELIEVGKTELDIAAEIEYAMRKAGSEGMPFNTIVASGKNSWLPHTTATLKKLNRGELIVVDLGATYKGYASDMTRTFSLSPTKKQLKLLKAVRLAQVSALARVRDGAKTSDVDGAARKVLTRMGYSKFCLHGTGHGVGLDIHEFPSLAPESTDVLRKNMVITVEPGAYVPKVGGARWEDTVLVKTDGYEIITKS